MFKVSRLSLDAGLQYILSQDMGVKAGGLCTDSLKLGVLKN